MSIIKDINLAPSGEMKINWVERNMPVLRGIGRRFSEEKPFKGLKVALSVHLEAKTAYLCRVMEMGGAEMYVTGSNPLSTQDDVAAALAAGGMNVFAEYGCTEQQYEDCLREVLKIGPNIIIDDGGDLVHLMHEEFADLIPGVIGGCEETTTGINRLRIMSAAGALRFPMVMVNDADCKHMFDNRYGTGQSVWDGICRTTNLIIAGKYVVISGYGWCGKGVSLRAKGLGAKIGDIFCTVTGGRDIITAEHFPLMKDGAILSNAGHFNVEVDMAALEKMAVKKYEARHNIQGYVMPDGRTLFTIAEGRLVNLAAADGHPAEIMDMSFAIQALSAKYLADNRGRLEADVVSVPREIDYEVARCKLDAMGVGIDSLSREQAEYLGK